MMEQQWFELKDARRKDWNKSVWIVLRAIKNIEEVGRYGFLGYKADFFGAGTVAFSLEQLDKVKNLGWSDIGIGQQHAGYVDDSEYIPAEVFRDTWREVDGVNLVLEQRSEGGYPRRWFLNPDIILTLGLFQDGNVWVCPKEGYDEVARIEYEDNEPVSLEIKSKYLKDYLCARGMFLYVTSYYSRDCILENVEHLKWEEKELKCKDDEFSEWEVRITPIHEGDETYGSKMAVFHMSRTDIDEDDELPDISQFPTDENTKSSHWERGFEGRKLYRVMGELWRNFVVNPSLASPIVRGDEVDSSSYFIIDLEGNKISGKELIDSGKWLWFKPDVMNILSSRRGGGLRFYSRTTGSVSCYEGYNTHFGVNDLGLVNVYAKDIGLLPTWQQQIWAGFNCSPEGGISKELHASQVLAEPADTKAPEKYLPISLDYINKSTLELFGFCLFRDHESIPDIVKSIHRFRSVTQETFYGLAKDLARVIVDNLDAASMQKIISPGKGERWGSIKSLEKLLSSKYDSDFVRKIMAPLVGVYELRHADAHLPGSQIEEAFSLIDIDRNSPFVIQGEQMLHYVVKSLFTIFELFRKWHNQPSD